MNKFTPHFPISCIGGPGVRLMDEGKVIKDQISAIGEVTASRAVDAEPGE